MEESSRDRRRQQLRQAQRRFRERQQKRMQGTIHVHHLLPRESKDFASPSTSALPLTAVDSLPAASALNFDLPPSLPAASSTKPKSFCDVIADNVNLVLDGIGKIDMDGIQLPNPYAPVSSSVAHPGMSDLRPLPSAWLQRSELSVAGNKLPSATTAGIEESADLAVPLAASGSWMSPLHMAARVGRENVVQSLLQHNASCNLRDSEGMTPLMHAVIGGFQDIIIALLYHGASIEQTDHHGRTALHWAVIEKQKTSLKVLLERGAKERRLVIDSLDETGMSPLQLAIEGGFEGGVNLLLDYGILPS